MNKWFVVVNKIDNICNAYNALSKFNIIKKNNISVFYQMDGRFAKDQIIINNDNYLIINDGIILNSHELMDKYRTPDLSSTIIEMLNINGHIYFNEFRGFFNGFLYDFSNKNNKLLCFTNHTGDSPLFSYEDEKIWVISSDFNLIVEFMKENSIYYTLNETSVKYLLSFGYMIDSCTIIKEINKVTAGNYLIYDGLKVTEKSYHRFKNNPITISMEEAIELIDINFRKAVSRCFNKDLEYGYINHLVDMSAGMDSRITNWVAKELGYQNIMNLSYSQSNSNEYKFAVAASLALKNEFLHKNLDDLNFLYEIDDLIKKNYGLAVFFGITGGKQFLESLNMDKFGLEHTGQLGDVIIGSFSKKEQHEKPIINSNKYSNTLAFDFSNCICNKYENHELFSLYTRGFLGALSTHLIRRNYTYPVSPFLDVDFISTCLSIPLKYRINHKLYWAWVDKKYSQAGKIPSTRIRNSKKIIFKFRNIHRKIFRISSNIIIKFLFKIKVINHSTTKNFMNPFNYWYDTNINFKEFLKTYYENNIPKLKKNEEIKNSVEKMYNSSKTMDKLMSLHVLSIIKTYF